jgi:hypothetical protein
MTTHKAVAGRNSRLGIVVDGAPQRDGLAQEGLRDTIERMDAERRANIDQRRAEAKEQQRKVIDDINREFCVVRQAGQIVILSERYDRVQKRVYHESMSLNDFHLRFANEMVVVSVDDDSRKKEKTQSAFWISHPDRRQYLNGVVFDPSTTEPRSGEFNLWTGFAYKPKPGGSWHKLKEHILSNVCNGEERLYEYLVSWMARAVQRPAEAGEVAVVLRGDQGTGKGVVGHAFLALFGRHGLHISSSQHLVGRFNQHLQDCVALFADEAFFAGDKANEGRLKALVTEAAVTIEAKYKNAVSLPNYLHIIMASNEQWVIPTSLQDRRFLVLNVSDQHQKDTVYFGAIAEELKANDNSGYSAMLHELLTRDLSGFNVRDIPDTGAKQEQQKLSLGTEWQWWQDVLHRGYVYESRLGLSKVFGEWKDEVATALLFKSYSEYAAQQHERRPMSQEFFGRFIKRVGGIPTRPRDVIVGEERAEEQTLFGSAPLKARPIKRDRAYGYCFGPLAEARGRFMAGTGLNIEWDGGDEEANRAAKDAAERAKAAGEPRAKRGRLQV